MDANTMETYMYTGDKAMNKWDKSQSFLVIYTLLTIKLLSHELIYTFIFLYFFLPLFLFLIKFSYFGTVI